MNKKIGQAKTDLERHFDLMQAKHWIASPQLVLQSYKSPLNGERIRQEKIENLSLSEQIDAGVNAFLLYTEKYRLAHKDGRFPAPAKRQLLEEQKEQFEPRH